MGVITSEEYELAKDYICVLESCICISQERIMEMMNDIAVEKKNYNSFKQQLAHYKDIYTTYEKQQEKNK